MNIKVCCLAELLLDPYYRTLDGFLLLIQKEWLWFGHKFSDRNGNYFGSVDDGNGNKNEHKHSKRERSPIFLQFLDCCFQVMMQFPWAFDFTQDLLLELAMHSSSGRFGDFFCNSMKERDAQQLWLKTPSLFKYLSALWKLGRFRNPDYIPTKTVLRPRYNVRDMILWDEVYCRFTLHDKDRHSSSIFTQQAVHHHSPTNDRNDAAANYLYGTPRGAAYSVSANRFHPRSPRLGSVQGVFNKKLQQNGSPVVSPAIAPTHDDIDEEEQKSPLNIKRTKPPPPPKKVGLTASDTAAINTEQSGYIHCVSFYIFIALFIFSCVYNSGSDFEDAKHSVAPSMVVPSINVNDQEEEDEDEWNRDNYDSDSASIPEKVKRITLLQQKVAQLESILQEYRNKERSNNRNRNSIDNVPNNNQQDEEQSIATPPVSVSISDYPLETNNVHKRFTPQSKGNIV